ncbi:unnamed protein product [Discosporangium mesarthrocarpum]
MPGSHLSTRNSQRPPSAEPFEERSYNRLQPEKVISRHAGTVLENGLDHNGVEITLEQRQAVKNAFQGELDGRPLDLRAGRQALERLGVQLDDAMFERLVEAKWSKMEPGDPEGVNLASFEHLYREVVTPAREFGAHLRKAAGRGESELVRELILRGCDPNTGSGMGETAMHTMAAHGQTDTARDLHVLCGKDVLIDPRDKAGWTPLMVAAGNGHTPFMRFLLEEGADVSAASDNGERKGIKRASVHWRRPVGDSSSLYSMAPS